MALTANDIVIFIPPWAPFQPFPPQKGHVVVVGASPEIIWLPNGARSVYTAIAAPLGVIRTAAPTLVDLTTWINQLVQPVAGGNPQNRSGRARGIVREVFLAGDPPTALTLIVETPDNQYYLTSALTVESVTA